MAKKKVIMLVGVPAAGKSYAADRLKDKYNYLSHDTQDRKAYVPLIRSELLKGSKPVLIEAPFNPSGLKKELEANGIEVKEYLVTAPLTTLEERYAARAGKAYPAQFKTNQARYEQAEGRFASKGSSDEIVKELLREDGNE